MTLRQRFLRDVARQRADRFFTCELEAVTRPPPAPAPRPCRFCGRPLRDDDERATHLCPGMVTG